MFWNYGHFPPKAVFPVGCFLLVPEGTPSWETLGPFLPASLTSPQAEQRSGMPLWDLPSLPSSLRIRLASPPDGPSPFRLSESPFANCWHSIPSLHVLLGQPGLRCAGKWLWHKHLNTLSEEEKSVICSTTLCLRPAQDAAE